MIMKTSILSITLTVFVLGSISYSDAFFEGGIVIEVPGQFMELSHVVISSDETMFVNGTFNQNSDGFTASVFKDYEDSREVVLNLAILTSTLQYLLIGNWATIISY